MNNNTIETTLQSELNRLDWSIGYTRSELREKALRLARLGELAASMAKLADDEFDRTPKSIFETSQTLSNEAVRLVEKLCQQNNQRRAFRVLHGLFTSPSEVVE